jgi:UDP-glucose 4-epimerase
MKILITGKNSFIGSNFKKYSCVGDIEEISLIENKPKDIDFRKFDIVLHLAAIVHQSKNVSEVEYFSVNRDLCLEVARQSRDSGVKQFIFLSTLKVYGNRILEKGIRTEESECFPEDPYGKSKLEAEISLKKLETTNFTVSIIRTALVYGNGVKANMLSLVKLVKYFPVLPFKDVSNKRNFTYIENLVGYIDKVIEKNASGTFIALDENAISTFQLVKFISLSLNKKVILFKLPKMIIKMGNRFLPEIFDRLYGSLEINNSITLKRLEYNPPFSTEEGIRRMIFSLSKPV